MATCCRITTGVDVDGVDRTYVCEREMWHEGHCSPRAVGRQESNWTIFKVGWELGPRASNLRAPAWAFDRREWTLRSRIHGAFFLLLWVEHDDWMSWKRHVGISPRRPATTYRDDA